jgi:hypothetical protein
MRKEIADGLVHEFSSGVSVAEFGRKGRNSDVSGGPKSGDFGYATQVNNNPRGSVPQLFWRLPEFKKVINWFCSRIAGG